MKLRKLRLRPKMIGYLITDSKSRVRYYVISQRAKRWEDRNKLKK